MAIVAAKCSGCGAPIEVNDGQREGTCPFCGTRYIAQDIIHNTVNNSYVTNNIGTAIVQGGDTPETLYERFEAFIGLGDLHSAESAAWEMQKKYPQKALTWYCAALYAEELIADGIKRGSERIDSYVARLHFPDAQKILSAQAIEDICSGAFKGLESACPPPESIAFGNVAQALEAAQGGAVEVVYVRSGEQRQTSLTPVWDASSAQWRAGMWVRDSSAGVGTMTFVDNDAGVFAGLGHPDSDTGESVALRSGEIVACSIVGCTSGTIGSPGELKGKFLGTHALGSIGINGPNGVYGTLRTALPGETRELAFAQEVVPGEAEIWATTEGETPRAYKVRIEKVNDADLRRNMILRVTDPALLAKTGGIVQGMSGSPILQNGRLVGAVTHVLVNDPTRGYGIFAQTMLEQAQQAAKTDHAA